MEQQDAAGIALNLSHGVLMQILDWLVCMPSNTKATPQKQKTVNAKVAKGECLQCGKKAAKGKRGLCHHHYYELRNERLRRGAGSLVYENQRIRNGTLLPDRQGKRSDLQKVS